MFATVADVEQRIEGGTDALAVLTGVTPYDADVVTAAIEGASGTIVAWVGRRYALPADTSAYPTLAAFLRELSLDLVEISLWGRVREQMPQRVKDKADAARQLLAAIAAGEAALPGGDALEASGGSAQVTGSERVFTRQKMDGMF